MKQGRNYLMAVAIVYLRISTTEYKYKCFSYLSTWQENKTDCTLSWTIHRDKIL